MPIALIVLTIAVLAGCCWASGNGFAALRDPLAAMAAIFLLGVSTIPLARRAKIATKARGWWPHLRKVALGVLLVWNGVGSLLGVYGIVSTVCLTRWDWDLPEMPSPLLLVLWCLSMPFTTAIVCAVLWSGPTTRANITLRMFAGICFDVWLVLAIMFVAFAYIDV